MNDIENDKDYQDIHEKYQASSNELPPLSIDESILKAAYKAVGSEGETHANSAEQSEQNNKFGVDTQPVKRAWYVPLSYVAMLVISLSVVMKLALEPDTAPMIAQTDLYQADAGLMDNLEQKELSSIQEIKSDSPRTLEDTNIERQELSKAPVAIAVMPAPTQAPAKVAEKAAMKKAAPSVASDDMQRAEQEVLYRQERLAKRKQRQNQEIMKSRAKLESDSVLMSEAADFASSGISEDRQEEKAKKPGVVAGLSRMERSDQIKDQDVAKEQQVLIDELVSLFENKQYKVLEQKLKEYRLIYPRIKDKEVLPRAMLDWEAKEIGKTSQKE